MSKYYQIQDFWKYLKNPHKYVGERPITLRSSWEIKFAILLDKHPSVLQWSSESIVIPYKFYDPKRGKERTHRYFVDFWMKVKEVNGKEKEYLIEIKPYAETIEPKKPKRHTKTYSQKCFTFLKNQSKWEATKKYCEYQKLMGRNIDFLVLTENELPIKD